MILKKIIKNAKKDAKVSFNFLSLSRMSSGSRYGKVMKRFKRLKTEVNEKEGIFFFTNRFVIARDMPQRVLENVHTGIRESVF